MNSIMGEILLTVNSDVSTPLNELIEDNFDKFDNHGSAEFTTAGNHNWVCPEGVHLVHVVLVGGGGGGGGGGTSYRPASNAGYSVPGSSGAGGGGGALVMGIVPVTPGVSYVITCGAGGTAGNVNSDGGDGGDSKFDSLLFADGGYGGNGPSDGYNATNAIGGEGGKIRYNSLVRGVITHVSEGLAGSNGSLYMTNDGSYITPSSKSGGLGNLDRGAGGSSGAGSNSNTGNKGSAGNPGYVSIFW